MALARIQTTFSGNPLDRADHLRTDPDIMGAKAASNDARFAVMASDQILSDPTGEPLWLSPARIKHLPIAEKIFLGLEDDQLRYGASLNASAEELADLFPDAKFRDARACATKLGTAHPSLGIIAQMKSMLSWHKTHQHCAKCGAPTELTKAGYERTCATCNTSHFPRTDPVVIMLALHGEGENERALVGRGYHLPAGWYSALAGFMEPGETIEEAVARELHEEAGVRANRVDYRASQPWPWPSTLMIGCFAWLEDNKLTRDKTEIEDLKWITKDEARKGLTMLDPAFMLPPSVAIAHNLILAWLEE